MSLAPLVGEDAAAAGQIGGAGGISKGGQRRRRKAGAAPIDRDRLHRKLRMAVQKPGDRQLVLLRGKGAGGIHQPSAGTQHPGGSVQNGVLPGGAQADIIHAPAGKGLGLLAKHPLAGAGSIHQHPVEVARQRLA